jgi:hypothetical protein
MHGDYLPRELENLWRELSVNPVPISLDELQAEAAKLTKTLRRRLVVVGGLALFGVVTFAVYFFVFPTVLQRIGSVTTIAGLGYMAGQEGLLRRSRAALEATEADCFRFYREELKRQRDFHRGWWLWSRIAVFFPGPLVFMVGCAQFYPQVAPLAWFTCATLLALAALGAVLNLRLARKYQRRIDALDRSQGGEEESL